MHAFSSESIPPRGLSLTHLAGKGLLVACHGHEAEKLAGMARIYIYPEPDLRPAYEWHSPLSHPYVSHSLLSDTANDKRAVRQSTSSGPHHTDTPESRVTVTLCWLCRALGLCVPLSPRLVHGCTGIRHGTWVSAGLSPVSDSLSVALEALGGATSRGLQAGCRGLCAQGASASGRALRSRRVPSLGLRRRRQRQRLRLRLRLSCRAPPLALGACDWCRHRRGVRLRLHRRQLCRRRRRSHPQMPRFTI